MPSKKKKNSAKATAVPAVPAATAAPEVLDASALSMDTEGSSQLDGLTSLPSGGIGEQLGFATELIASVMPTAENLADMFKKEENKAKGMDNEDIVEGAKKAGALDWLTRQKMSGRRPSLTAHQCKLADCGILVFGVSDYCCKHDPDANKTMEESLAEFAVASEDAVTNDSESTKVDDTKDATKDSKKDSKKGSKKDAAAKDATKDTTDASTVPPPPEPTNNKKGNAKKADMKKLFELRSAMNAASEQLDIKDNITSEEIYQSVSLKGINIKSWEKAQLQHQFNMIDADKNGLITSIDLEVAIKRFNAVFLQDKTAEDLNKLLSGWIRDIHPKSKVEMSAIEYATAVMKLRTDENKLGYNVCRTAFWDLRAVILSYPTKAPQGWILKRGNALAMERANAWKRRYFAPVVADEKTGVTEMFQLGYYVNPVSPIVVSDTETKDDAKDKDKKDVVDTTMKGTIDLLEVTVIDVSPKTPVSDTLFGSLSKAGVEDLDKYLVFKVSVANGRRYTLAAPEDDAIRWLSYFTWWSNAYRISQNWIDQWGTRRNEKITMRDWALAGSVVAKAALGESFKETKTKELDEKPLSGAQRKQELDKIQEEWEDKYEITDRDRFYLQICGIEEDTMLSAESKVLSAVKTIAMNKSAIIEFDNANFGSALNMGVKGLIGLMNAFAYGAAFKNRYRQNIYKIKWDSKSDARDCAVCGLVFKSVTLRKTMGKHHCRCCGRVVCHTCGSKEVYLSVTDKYERVCESCILTGHPPIDRIVRDKEEVIALKTELTDKIASGDRSSKTKLLLQQINETQSKMEGFRHEEAVHIDDVKIDTTGKVLPPAQPSKKAASGGGGCCIIA